MIDKCITKNGEIDINIALKEWDKNCFLSVSNKEYSINMATKKTKIKINTNKATCIQLIEKLGLISKRDILFSSYLIYKTRQSFELDKIKIQNGINKCKTENEKKYLKAILNTYEF